MKKKIVMLTAALAALTAFPVAAGAAGGSPEQWDSTDNCEQWDSTDNCEGTGWAVPETGVMGDVDCDGRVQIADAILFSRYLAEDPLVTVFTAGLHNANCNGDDALDASDLIAILRILIACDPGSEYAREMLGDLTDVTAETTTAGEGWDSTDNCETCYDYTDNCETGEWWDSTDNCETCEWWESTDNGAYGYLGIANLNLTDEQSLSVYGVPAPKTVYQIGEELDLSNMVLEGYGYCNGCNWDIFPFENTRFLDEADDIFVYTGEFNSDMPGVYTIYLTSTGEFPANGSFTVTVKAADEEDTPEESYNLWVEGDSWKTVHHLLDPLDIWNAQLYGSGTNADGSTWELNGEYTVWEACDAGLISVNTGRFDSRVPGEYTVTLYYPLKDAKGIIPVTVLPTISEDNPASKNWYGEQGGDLVFMVYEPDVKLTYRIGEELAVDNIGFYAKNDIPENSAYPEASHWYWFDIKTGDYPECLDTSEFDSTQPGIYKIRLSFPELNAEGWFEVRVVGD